MIREVLVHSPKSRVVEGEEVDVCRGRVVACDEPWVFEVSVGCRDAVKHGLVLNALLRTEVLDQPSNRLARYGPIFQYVAASVQNVRGLLS